jgi:hypothetical protein
VADLVPGAEVTEEAVTVSIDGVWWLAHDDQSSVKSRCLALPRRKSCDFLIFLPMKNTGRSCPVDRLMAQPKSVLIRY